MKRKIVKRIVTSVLMLALVLGFAVTGSSDRVSASTKIKLSKSTIKIKAGQSKQLKLKKGKRVLRGVKWKSSNKKVATVSAKGRVAAKKTGKARITAKYKKKTYKCNVTVTSVKKNNNSEKANEETSKDDSAQTGNKGDAKKETEEQAEEQKTIKTERGSDILRIAKKNADGTTNTIYGKIYTPEAEGKSPAIILCHGYNGVNTDFVNECNYYADNGYIAYAFDFCGGSGAGRCRSTGRSTDMTITTEKEDLLAVFDHISSMDIVDENKVFVMGGSQGGLVATLATEERADKVAGMLLYFPALCIPDNWKGMYKSLDEVPAQFDFWGLMLGKGFVEDLWNMPDIFTMIGKYEGDVLIIHGDNDTIAPISYSQKAVTIYPHAKLLTLPGEIHGFTPAGQNTAKQNVLEFMDVHTGK